MANSLRNRMENPDAVRLELRKSFNYIPARLNVGFMVFFACFFTYMLRANMSINLLAMVQPTASLDPNTTAIDPPDYGTRYNWTPWEQSLLLGSFFWGYVLAMIPGGLLSSRMSSRNLLTISFLMCAVYTALGPLAAHLSFWLSCGLRVLLGIFSSIVYPALHHLIAHWAPPHERGKFVSAMFGSAIGTVATWPLAGILIETLGWVYAFYVPAGLVFLFTLVCFLVIYDAPAKHPRISTKEKEYIESHITELSSDKSWPPMLSMAGSVPFWALLVLHYGNVWGNFFLLTGAPKFMNEVLGFNLAKAGILASVPYLSRCIAGIIFGCAGDFMHRKQWMSVTNLRKFFCIFSHIIPGLFLISMVFVDDQPYAYVAIITASLGFNGAAALTNLLNAQDLAPNYAGTVYSIINTAGTTAGFVTPLVVAYFTKDSNTIEDWNYLFVIGGIVYIGTAFVFILFGSGEVQKWNQSKTHAENST